MSATVISLKVIRNLKEAEREDYAYQAQILTMSKLELLEEMVRFQEERSKVASLTPQMMLRGKYLFKALEESAETQELKLLTRSYRRHLEYELQEHLKRSSGQ